MRSLSLLILAGAASAAFPALAAEKVDEPKSEPDPMAKICNAFGPGYTLVPGTTTCIKIGGYVRGSVTFTDKGGSGDFVPGAGTGNPPSR